MYCTEKTVTTRQQIELMRKLFIHAVEKPRSLTLILTNNLPIFELSEMIESRQKMAELLGKFGASSSRSPDQLSDNKGEYRIRGFYAIKFPRRWKSPGQS